MLQQLIPGREYIRILPVRYANNVVSYNYCNTILVFDGCKDDGTPIFHYPERYEHIVIPKFFFDGNWRPASIIRDGDPTELTKWVGKKVIRKLPSYNGGLSYLYSPVRLVSATKHHVVIINPITLKEQILDIRFADPSDWKLA